MNSFFKVHLLLITVLCSCTTRNANITKSYLNYRYSLVRAGDLHGLPPTSNEVLDRNEGFSSYIGYFNKNESFMDFHCKGSSFNDFYCEGTFKLVDIDDNVLFFVESFRCQYSGGQSGLIIYEDEVIKDKIGTIYVYTPYWCRWQFEFDTYNDGNKILLTFEFWKSSFNDLPDFVENDE